jgi:MoxR-like ATPase
MTAFADHFHSMLEALSTSGKLSKTGTGRFDPLIEELGKHLSIPTDEIYVVSCARPNNLNIRLTQGKSQHRHNVLGLGVIPKTAEVPKIVAGGLKAGANFIGDGKAQYDAVGVVVKQDGRWMVGGLVESDQSEISKALLTDFPGMIVHKAKAAPAPAAPAAAGSVAPSAAASAVPAQQAVAANISQLIRDFHNDLKSAQLIFSDELIVRFCAALLARRFLVLTGLSGSGKTKLAEAFARWLTPPVVGATSTYYKIIPVGADWTSSEQVLGYADALNPKRYELRPTLELLLHALDVDRSDMPHVLILDEMNLSHVERYFSEFLSVMETGAPIELYSGAPRDSVPASLTLPNNVFIAGTVNVDETTYLFSPKVLDRANVVEFRADEDEVFSFLENFSALDLPSIDGRGERYASAFLTAARSEPQLDADDREAVAEAFRRVFRVASCFGREFGFRTLRDVGRYVHFHRQLVGDEAWDVADAIDAQIYQRILPRLHGSRAQVQELIWALGYICLSDSLTDADFEERLVKPLMAGTSIRNPFEADEFVSIVANEFTTAKYPLSCEKLYRMNRKLRDGFVSFMEA